MKKNFEFAEVGDLSSEGRVVRRRRHRRRRCRRRNRLMGHQRKQALHLDAF